VQGDARFSATMRETAVRIAKKVDFHRLPRPVQDRFVAATRGTAPPLAILFQGPPRAKVWALLGGSAIVTVIALVLLRAGWGDVTSPVALHGAKLEIVDVLLWAMAAYGVVHAMALLRALDSLPYKAGTYLFPGCLVEALGPVLRVWAVADAESVERVSSPTPGLELRMRDGSRMGIRARSTEETERAEAQLTQTMAELARATEYDGPILAEVDPLHVSALSSPVGPTEMMKSAVPAWTRFDWAVAAGLGVVLGLGLGWVRNGMSDDAMYRWVAASASVPVYQLYLTQGGRHTAEVRDVLLPRAELVTAAAQGSVDAVQAFAREHASSKIGPEIDAALRHAMLGELEKARKLGTVGALDDFAKRFPDNNLGPELKAARHGLYAQALADWKKKSHADAATTAFMERLFVSVEASGNPTCELRFRTRPSRTLEEADKAVVKSNHYPGADALPSKYVTTAAMRQREHRVAADVVKGFAAGVSADVLSMREGEPLDADAPNPTAVPTLVVDYSPEWSHVNTICTKPNTVFSGFNFAFDASFVLPEGAPLVVKVKSWRGAEIWKIKDEGISREDFEQKIYDTMFDGAFDQLDKKLADALF
jgi:hypothetical protein